VALWAEDVRFELATPSDFEVLVDLHVRSWQSAYAGIVPDGFLAHEIGPMFRAWRRDELPLLQGSQTWLARGRGRVLAFADLGPGRDSDATSARAELYAFHVDPDARGLGLGTRLLSTALEGLSAQGYEVITAWVLEANYAAHRFYLGRGWQKDGRTLVEKVGSATLREVRFFTVISA